LQEETMSSVRMANASAAGDSGAQRRSGGKNCTVLGNMQNEKRPRHTLQRNPAQPRDAFGYHFRCRGKSLENSELCEPSLPNDHALCPEAAELV